MRLPVLDNVKVASPCNADWDDMSGDERVRFCGKCEKNVYNLSMMTRVEGEALIREKEGKMCVRFYRRPDGTLLTSDCPVGVQRLRLRARVWASVTSAAASFALVAGLFGGRARADLALVNGKQPVAGTSVKQGGMAAPAKVEKLMGKIALPPAPPPKVVKPAKPVPPPPRAEMGEPMMGDITAEK
jgi:hypothetical protein